MVERTGQEQIQSDEQVSSDEKGHRLPLSTIKKIMKEQGVLMITKPALEEVRMILYDVLKDVSRKTVIFTRHRGKKTSNKDDVLLSLK